MKAGGTFRLVPTLRRGCSNFPPALCNPSPQPSRGHIAIIAAMQAKIAQASVRADNSHQKSRLSGLPECLNTWSLFARTATCTMKRLIAIQNRMSVRSTLISGVIVFETMSALLVIVLFEVVANNLHLLDDGEDQQDDYDCEHDVDGVHRYLLANLTVNQMMNSVHPPMRRTNSHAVANPPRRPGMSMPMRFPKATVTPQAVIILRVTGSRSRNATIKNPRAITNTPTIATRPNSGPK